MGQSTRYVLMENKMKKSIHELFQYKGSCFLNSRNSFRVGEGFLYENDTDVGASFLKLDLKSERRDLIRWYDDLPYLANSKGRMLKYGYTENDMECVETFLSRLGYLFRIDNRCRTNKDYNLLYFILQLTNLKECRGGGNSSDDDERLDALMSQLFQAFLCELFLHYETFSRFSVKSGELMFETECVGEKKIIDIINEIHSPIECSSLYEPLKLFHLTLVEFLISPSLLLKDRFVFDGVFSDDIYADLVFPEVFVNGFDKNKEQIFSALRNIFNSLQSTKEIFVSNIILTNYVFYVLKNSPSKVLEFKNFINDDNEFFNIMKLIICRRIMMSRRKFSGFGMDNILERIPKDEDFEFYNLIS